jgi:hypothetical protein
MTDTAPALCTPRHGGSNDGAYWGSLHHSRRIGEKGLLFPGKISS